MAHHRLGKYDVVDGIASHRPYRPALGTEKAIEEILQNSNVLYDNNVVNACVKIIKEKKTYIMTE